MGEVMFVEVLDRRGRLLGRHRIDAWPVTIGRAYSNDIIVDDPFVCPTHLRLVRNGDGELHAEDLGSVNGIHGEPDGGRTSRMALTPDTRLRIGNTVLRLRGRDAAVPAALVHHQEGHRPPLFATLPFALACWFVVPLLLWQHALLDAYERTRGWETAGMGILLAALVACWAAAWSLVNRVVAHEWRFLAHASVACVFLAFDAFTDFVRGYIDFLAGGTWAGTLLGGACDLVPVIWLLVTQLALLGAMRRSQRLAVALLTGVALVALSSFVRRGDSFTFSNQIRFSAVLRPFPRSWMPASSVDAFVADAPDLEREVRELAAER